LDVGRRRGDGYAAWGLDTHQSPVKVVIK